MPVSPKDLFELKDDEKKELEKILEEIDSQLKEKSSDLAKDGEIKVDINIPNHKIRKEIVNRYTESEWKYIEFYDEIKNSTKRHYIIFGTKNRPALSLTNTLFSLDSFSLDSFFDKFKKKFVEYEHDWPSIPKISRTDTAPNDRFIDFWL